MVMSAVSSVSTPGVLVTVMPRCDARVVDVDIVDAVAEIGDQLELLAGLAEHRGVDAVGDGRHQHVGGLHRLGELGLAHRLVVEIEPRVEQLAHAGLDAVGQLARDDDQRLLGFGHVSRHRVGNFGCGNLAVAKRYHKIAARRISPVVQASLTVPPDTARPSVGGVPLDTLYQKARSGQSIRVRAVRVRSPALCVLAYIAGRCAAHAAGELATGSTQRPAGAALRQPEVRSGQCPRWPDPDHDVPGSIPARACRSRSPPSSRTGAASAIGKAPRAGSITRCCPAGAPRW